MRRIAGVSLALASLSALVACASVQGAGEGPREQTTPTASHSSEPQSQTPSPSPSRSRAIQITTCVGNYFAVIYVDVETAKITPPQETYAPCPPSSSPIDLHDFSADLTQYAMELPKDEDDSQHVGWLDVESGKITDVTAKVTAATSSAMSAQPQHFYPTFSPDGAFVFYDSAENTLVKVNSRTFETSPLPRMASMTDRQIFIGPDDVVSNRGQAYYLPSEIPGAPGSTFCNRPENPVQQWLGDGTVLLRHEGRVAILRNTSTTTGSGCTANEVVRFLSPESDFRVEGMTLDSKTGTVYFNAWRGAEMKLFSVPVDGSAEPEIFADLAEYSEPRPGITGKVETRLLQPHGIVEREAP